MFTYYTLVYIRICFNYCYFAAEKSSKQNTAHAQYYVKARLRKRMCVRTHSCQQLKQHSYIVLK